MFYVVRKGEPIGNYHAAFVQQYKAQEYAEGLHRDFGHNYDVIHVTTVWTTPPMTTVADLKREGVL